MHNSKPFTVVSWNINSLNAKRAPVSKPDTISIESWFDVVNPSIVVFQESMWKNPIKN